MTESMYEELWPKTGYNASDSLNTTPRNVRGSVKVGWLTPFDVHHGLAEQRIAEREVAL